jgi:hypothetical protein
MGRTLAGAMTAAAVKPAKKGLLARVFGRSAA